MKFMIVKIMAVFAALLFLIITATSSFATGYWTEWQQLNDTAYNGIYFSYKNDCPQGNENTCTLNWSFKNTYNKDVTISYRVTYLSPAGSEEASTGNADLKVGANELTGFRAVGRKLTGVKVGLIVSSDTRARVQREQDEKKVAEERQRLAEEKKQREIAEYNRQHPEVFEAQRRAEEAQYLAMQQLADQQRADQQRRDEASRQQEEYDRQDRERERRNQEAADEAEAEQKRQDRKDIAQAWQNGINSMGDSVNRGLKTYGNAVQAKIDADNYVREEKARRAREAREAQDRFDREQREAQRIADERRERERRDAEQQEAQRQQLAQRERDRQEDADRLARQQEEERKRNDLSRCVDVTSSVSATVYHSKPGTNCDGHYSGALTNHLSQRVYCSWNFVKSGQRIKGSGGGGYFNPGLNGSGGMWTCGGGPNDSFVYACTSNVGDMDCEVWTGKRVE